MKPAILFKDNIIDTFHTKELEALRPVLDLVQTYSDEGSVVFICSALNLEKAESCSIRLESAGYHFNPTLVTTENGPKGRMDDSFWESMDYLYDVTLGNCLYITEFEEAGKLDHQNLVKNGLTIVCIPHDPEDILTLNFDGIAEEFETSYNKLSRQLG